MAHQKDKLEKVGLEGFALLDEHYGRKQKGKLVKVGMEGFALLEEHFGRKKKHQFYNHNNQQQCFYQGSQVITVKEPVTDSNHEVQFYRGMFMDHSRRKPSP